MKKLLAIAGLGAAATIGFSGPAVAVYPPNSPGTINIHDPICTYVEGSQDQLASWSVTFDYTVTAPDAYLTVINPNVDDIIWSRDAPIGSGSLTVDNTTPGAGGGSPIVGNVYVTIGAGEQYVSAQSVGCLVGDPTDPTTPPDRPHIEVRQPACNMDSQDPAGGVIDWSFTVDAYTPLTSDFLIVADATADIWYRVDLPQGETSVVIDSSIDEFSGSLAPYQPYTVTLVGAEDTIEVPVNPCPIASDRGPSDPGPSDQSSTTAPGGGNGTENRNAASSTSTTQVAQSTSTQPTSTSTSTTATGSTTTSTTANSTSTGPTSTGVATTTTLAPQTKLPKTGSNAGQLAAVALALCAGGGGLVWVARRRAMIE